MGYIFRYKTIKNIFIILVLLTIFISIYLIILLNKNTFYNGVSINNINVSGYEREEALELLKERYSNLLTHKKIILTFENNMYYISGESIDLTYDYYDAIDNAYKIGRRNNFIRNLIEINKSRVTGKNIDMNLSFDINKLYLEITKISNLIDIEVKDASIEHKNNKFIIYDEIIGRKVDKNELEMKITKSIHEGKVIKIPVNVIYPKIKRSMLSQINTKIGSFITYFNTSDENRVSNLELASKQINGKILLQGDIFSFNSLTGNRDAESGYKEGKAIIDGEYVPQIAGGVCQVSSTMYNAALLSNLKIIERHPHSLPVSYVKYGRDATVAYDYYDLKFENIFKFPVYIECIVYDNRIISSIYSNEVLNKNIYIESIIIDEINYKVETIKSNTLKAGEKRIIKSGKKGYKVETYRIDKDNSNKELISTDYYKPVNAIIEEGY